MEVATEEVAGVEDMGEDEEAMTDKAPGKTEETDPTKTNLKSIYLNTCHMPFHSL